MKHPTARPAAALTVVAALGFGLSACSPASSEDGGLESGTVKVGTLRGQPHLYTPYFYEQFAPEDAEFEIILFDTSTDIKNAVVSGSVDFGVTGVPSALVGAAADQDVRIVASSADGGTGIVGSPDISGPEDLAGKRIGYPMGASQEILLKLTLQEHGLDPASDVELINLPFSDMAGALGSGQIDAFSSAELGPSIALQDGAHEIVSPYDTPVGKVNIALITTGDEIASDPELVQAVVDTHIQATEHMVEDPDAWAGGVVETFGIDRAVVDTSVENIWPRWELDEQYRQEVSALADEMLAVDQLPAAVDPSLIFDTTFVDASTHAG